MRHRLRVRRSGRLHHWIVTAAVLMASSPTLAQVIPLPCDADANGVIDRRDISLIMSARNTTASGPADPRDPNRDGVINVLDSRFCATQCTASSCAIVPAIPPPVANAGRDQMVGADEPVELDGTGSTSARGDPITFQWSFVSKPANSTAVLSSSSVPRPTFVADQSGMYQLQLVVTDAHGIQSVPAVVNIAAGSGFNVGPVASAGKYPIVAVGGPVTLDASGSTDIAGGPLSYEWRFLLTPAGSAAAPDSGPSGSDSPTATFLADLFGQYYAQLTVTDPNANSATANVMIDTQQRYRSPVANPGEPQLVQPGQAVQLDGSGSTDPDGSPIASYQWQLLWKPPGSAAQLSSATASTTSFVADQPGDYIAQLIVTANGLTSTASTVLISTSDVPPRADAGPDQTVYAGDTATLSGSGSDADGQALSYRWSMLAAPAGGGIALNGAQTPSASFSASMPGTYVAQLIVNDGRADSIPALTHVVAVTPTTADLALNETAGTMTPLIGGDDVLTLTVSDLGPLPATAVTVSDLLPSGLTLVSASPSQGSYNASTGVWTVGAIARNGNATLALTATVLGTGATANTASISSSSPADPNPANNSATLALTPAQPAVLTVAVSSSNPQPLAGSDVTFTLTVVNSGPIASTGTVVTDRLPAGFGFVSADTAAGSYSSSTGQWNIGSLAAGATVTLTLTTVVQASGPYANTATVAASNVLSGAPGESATASVSPVFPPTVSITAPADGARFIAPASYGLTIAAASQSGVIAQLAIYDGSSLVQTVPVNLASVSFTLSFSGLGAGTHTYTAVATDGQGNSTTSNAVHVTVVSPTASSALIAPEQNAFFIAPATITLLATAASSTGSVSRVEFFRDGVSVGTAARAPYSVTLTGVPSGTYHFTVQVTDSTSTVASSAVQVTVGSASTLTITAPSQGASIASDAVAVSGTVQAPPNSAVTVGGLPATIAAGSFFASNVPLQPGANSIAVVLTDPAGNQTTQTLSVTSTGKPAFRFRANPLGVQSQTSGLAPLTVEFALSDPGGAAATRVDLSCFGNGTVDHSTSPLDTKGGSSPIGTCTYSQPGVYTALASVIDSSSGQDQVVYSATQTVVVTDPAALDALLRSQWSGMNDALVAGDRVRALGYLDEPAQATYGTVFSELAGALPGIVASYSDLYPISKSNSSAEYLVTRPINGTQQAFIITFVNVGGVWQLDMM